MGYRHLDCAQIYSNEAYIGKSIAKVIEEGTVKREDLWITAKVYNHMHEKVEEACK